MSMTGRVSVRNLALHAPLGVSLQEQTVGIDVRVSFTLEVDMTKACEEDDIAGTVDYGDAIARVATVMQTPMRLIEHAAWRVMNSLREAYPRAIHGQITVSKLAPPCSEQVECADVTLDW